MSFPFREMNEPQQLFRKLAWFWTYRAALFVGYAGETYPESKQIEECTHRSAETACEVFTRQISPWAEQLNPTHKTPTLYFKQIFEPPTN